MKKRVPSRKTPSQRGANVETKQVATRAGGRKRKAPEPTEEEKREAKYTCAFPPISFEYELKRICPASEYKQLTETACPDQQEDFIRHGEVIPDEQLVRFYTESTLRCMNIITLKKQLWDRDKSKPQRNPFTPTLFTPAQLHYIEDDPTPIPPSELKELQEAREDRIRTKAAESQRFESELRSQFPAETAAERKSTATGQHLNANQQLRMLLRADAHPSEIGEFFRTHPPSYENKVFSGELWKILLTEGGTDDIKAAYANDNKGMSRSDPRGFWYMLISDRYPPAQSPEIETDQPRELKSLWQEFGLQNPRQKEHLAEGLVGHFHGNALHNLRLVKLAGLDLPLGWGVLLFILRPFMEAPHNVELQNETLHLLDAARASLVTNPGISQAELNDIEQKVRSGYAEYTDYGEHALAAYIDDRLHNRVPGEPLYFYVAKSIDSID
jgi:hypothetical protein